MKLKIFNFLVKKVTVLSSPFSCYNLHCRASIFSMPWQVVISSISWNHLPKFCSLNFQGPEVPRRFSLKERLFLPGSLPLIQSLFSLLLANLPLLSSGCIAGVSQMQQCQHSLSQLYFVLSSIQVSLSVSSHFISL